MKNNLEQQDSFFHDHHGHEHHNHSLFDELAVHLPVAVFSVAISMMVLSIMTGLLSGVETHTANGAYHQLFHVFHYLHIVFAGIGTLLTYFNFSQALLPGILVGIFSPAIFCILSDIVLPYAGGLALGVPMQLHICFFSERFNIITFLLIGLVTGLLLNIEGKRGVSNTGFIKVIHFGHVLLGALAALFYTVSNGFYDWADHLGIVFLVMIICVVVPCTFSDVIVPIFVAKKVKR